MSLLKPILIECQTYACIVPCSRFPCCQICQTLKCQSQVTCCELKMTFTFKLCPRNEYSEPRVISQSKDVVFLSAQLLLLWLMELMTTVTWSGRHNSSYRKHDALVSPVWYITSCGPCMGLHVYRTGVTNGGGYRHHCAPPQDQSGTGYLIGFAHSFVILACFVSWKLSWIRDPDNLLQPLTSSSPTLECCCSMTWKWLRSMVHTQWVLISLWQVIFSLILMVSKACLSRAWWPTCTANMGTWISG